MKKAIQVTSGNYHSNAGRFDLMKSKPPYKNYGKYKEDKSEQTEISLSEQNTGLSVKRVCEIFEECGNHKYTYDENFELKDFCKKVSEDRLLLCKPSENCMKK